MPMMCNNNKIKLRAIFKICLSFCYFENKIIQSINDVCTHVMALVGTIRWIFLSTSVELLYIYII